MRNDIVAQAKAVRAKTANRITTLTDAGAKQMKLYCAAGNEPTADSGLFAGGAEPWEAGKAYAKNDLFSYEGNMGFVKQAHTSAAHWIPFSVGTESLYGARPAPMPTASTPILTIWRQMWVCWCEILMTVWCTSVLRLSLICSINLTKSRLTSP